MKPTMAAAEAVAYIQGHRTRPPDGLGVALALDFGSGENGGGTVDTAAVRARLEAIQAECDRDGLRWYDVQPGETKLQVEAFARDIQAGLGRIYAHAEAGLALVGGAPGGEQPPPPTQYDSFGGTWGAEHNPAFDLYPNGEDGPHYGHPFRCPAAGTVTRYSFGPGPLGLQGFIQRGSPASALQDAGDHTALLVHGLLLPEHVEAIRTLGTFMHIAVLTFDQPQRTPGGYTVRAIWIGHVQDGFVVGGRSTNDLFCLCGRSGVEFPGVDAAHGHVCGTATGALSPNGDIPGVEVARLLGFNPRVTQVPGPAHYQAGMADRGKFR